MGRAYEIEGMAEKWAAERDIQAAGIVTWVRAYAARNYMARGTVTRILTTRGDQTMTERIEVLTSMLGATLLSHPDGHGQPYWRRGELSEAVKAVRKDAGFFASSHGARSPRYEQPDVKFNGMCIIRRLKNGKYVEEITGRFIKWNPRTNRTTVLTEDELFKSGEFFCKA